MKRFIIPALLIVASYYAIFGGGYSVLDLNRIHAETRTAEALIEELRQETHSLELRAEALENDPRTLERLARERFGMIRDGEILYRFAERSDSTDPEVDTAPAPR